MILNGAYIHRRNIAGYTALYLATLKNNINIVRLLLGHGANINDIGEKHGTPLHVAAKGGHDDMAEFLLFHGAEIDFKNMDGNSPLYFAMNFPKIMKLLIRHGANVNDRNNEGFTPLHTAVSKGKEDAVKVLLRNGSDIDALRTSNFNYQQESSLHMAVRNDDFTMVQLFIHYNANINVKSGLGHTPLVLSITLNRTKISEILIQNGAFIDYASAYGSSIIDYAIHIGDDKMVQIINANIDFDKFRNNFGETPLEKTIIMGEIEMTKLIVFHS